MIFTRLIFAWRYKRAVKLAWAKHHQTNLRQYVILVKGKLVVVDRWTIRDWVKQKRFAPWATAYDIERKALFTTHYHI